MTGDLQDYEAICHAADRLLLRAEVAGRLPTPVADILAAEGLVEPRHSMLSDFVFQQAPLRIQKAFRRIRFKVQALLDRQAREVHIDPSLQEAGRGAFKRLHEVGHDMLEWQRDLAYADDRLSLSWETRLLFERQANQGAAELLFQRDLFAEIARDYDVGTRRIIELASRFGASYHAAFRRFIETHSGVIAGVVVELSPCATEPLAYRRREAVCSKIWETRFGSPVSWPPVLCVTPFSFVDLAQDAQHSRDVIPGHFILPDLNNETVPLKVEAWSNSFHVFVLLWMPRRQRRLSRSG